jgi:hypothetical protein
VSAGSDEYVRSLLSAAAITYTSHTDLDARLAAILEAAALDEQDQAGPAG